MSFVCYDGLHLTLFDHKRINRIITKVAPDTDEGINMKKIYSLYCLIVAMLVTTSCSQDVKMESLLEQIPANSDVVLVGNLKTVLESAGGSLDGSKIKLPSEITYALPNGIMDDYDEANDFLKTSGIDPDACALVLSYEHSNYPILVFALSDEKQFIKAIEDNGFRERGMEETVTLYKKKVYDGGDPAYDDYGYIAVNGAYAYWIESVWVGSNFQPLQYLQKMIEDASVGSYADTNYGEYITDGNVGGIAISWPKEYRKELRNAGVSSELLSIYEGTMCLRGSLSDDRCTVELRLFDKDGNRINADIFKKFMDTSAMINGDALAMLGKDEYLISAVSLKNFDWEKYFDFLSGASRMSRSDKAQLNAILSYLEKIDGTIAVGFGFTDGLESIINLDYGKDVMSQISTTLVVEAKEGKAKKLVEDMKGFLEQAEVPFTESQSGFSIDLERFDLSGTLYAVNKGNFIVMANHPIKDNNSNALITNTDLTDYLYVMCLGLNRNDRLMRDLHIDYDVKCMLCCEPNTLETTMTLEIKGDDDQGVIARAAKIVLGIISQQDDIEERINELREDYSYDYYEDDTIAYFYDDDDDYYYADSVEVEVDSMLY